MPEHASGARRKLARLVGKEGRERKRKKRKKKKRRKEGGKKGRRVGGKEGKREGWKENKEEERLEKKLFFLLFMELLQLFFCFPRYTSFLRIFKESTKLQK